MATIGTLAVNVVARTGPLEKGLKKSRKQVRGFSAGVGRAGGALLKLAGPLAAAAAGAVGVGAAIRGITTAMGDIDQIAKLSSQIGMSTEALSSFRLAAGLTGSSAGAMDASLSRVSRRLGLFAQGSGAAKHGLETLGFSANSFQGVPLEKSLGMIADRIAGVGDVAAQNAAAFEIFGQGGQALLPILRSGSAGLEEIQKHAAALGVTFNAVDAAKVETANDAIAEMKAAAGGLFREIAIALAPTIRVLANNLVELTQSFRGWTKIIDTEMLAGIVDLLIGMVSPVMGLVRAYRYLRGEARHTQLELPKVAGALADVTAEAEAALPAFEEAGGRMAEISADGARAWEDYQDQIKGANSELEDTKTRLDDVRAGQVQAVGATTRRSTAGFSAVAQSQRTMEKLHDIQRKQLAVALAGNEQLAVIHRDLKHIKPKVAQI